MIIDLEDTYDRLMEAYCELKEEVRRRDKHLYERWKAGGFLIDGDIISMYPNARKVVESLVDETEEEDQDEDA